MHSCLAHEGRLGRTPGSWRQDDPSSVAPACVRHGKNRTARCRRSARSRGRPVSTYPCLNIVCKFNPPPEDPECRTCPLQCKSASVTPPGSPSLSLCCLQTHKVRVLCFSSSTSCAFVYCGSPISPHGQLTPLRRVRSMALRVRWHRCLMIVRISVLRKDLSAGIINYVYLESPPSGSPFTFVCVDLRFRGADA